MTNPERVAALLDYFLAEPQSPYRGERPHPYRAQRDLLQALLDTRDPAPVSEDVLHLQDQLLQEELRDKGVIGALTLPRLDDLFPGSAIPHAGKLCLWHGDITRLEADAIVNAANSRMLGCFQPLHRCIDNAIHAASGIRLRLACDAMMRADYCSGDWEEPTGQARITPGFNLPSRNVIHTVGPIVTRELKDRERRLLESCYTSCLELAAGNGCRSVAFCSISTGVFRFPVEKAAPIALGSELGFVDAYHETLDLVIFDVFSQEDYACYERLFKERSYACS